MTKRVKKINFYLCSLLKNQTTLWPSEEIVHLECLHVFLLKRLGPVGYFYRLREENSRFIRDHKLFNYVSLSENI